jgi:diamine N-acetyltransferase
MNQKLTHGNVRLRALEPDDIDLLYDWENNMEIWHVSNTLEPFSKYFWPNTSKNRTATFTRPNKCV